MTCFNLLWKILSCYDNFGPGLVLCPEFQTFWFYDLKLLTLSSRWSTLVNPHISGIREALGNLRWEKESWCGSSSPPSPFAPALVSPQPCTCSSSQGSPISSSHTWLSGAPWGWFEVMRPRLTLLLLCLCQDLIARASAPLPSVLPPAFQFLLYSRSPPQHWPPNRYFLVSYFLEQWRGVRILRMGEELHVEGNLCRHKGECRLSV